MMGFYRSKVMAILFVGMPLLAVLLYVLAPDIGGMPLGSFTAVLISSMAGLLASTTLTVSIINDRTRGVYDLFLVRPVRPSHLLVARYIAVLVCVITAAALAIVLANGYDWASGGAVDLGALAEPLLVTLTMACVSCAAAVLVGSLIKSVLAGVILTLYGGNQLSAAVILPSLQNMTSVQMTAIVGLLIAAVVVSVAVVIFSRKLSN